MKTSTNTVKKAPSVPVKKASPLPRITPKKPKNTLKGIPKIQYGVDSKTGKKFQYGV